MDDLFLAKSFSIELVPLVLLVCVVQLCNFVYSVEFFGYKSEFADHVFRYSSSYIETT